VAVLSPIWVNFSLSENEMQRYRRALSLGLLRAPKDENYEVEVILSDGSLFPHTGRITFAEPSYNMQTGTFLLRASVNNPDGILRPNQFVRVRVKGAVMLKSVLVPQRAVQQGSKGHFVWVVDKEGKAEQRPVVVGEWHGDDWFIYEGPGPANRWWLTAVTFIRSGCPIARRCRDGINPADSTSPKTGTKSSGK
jgi:membrane fusion protein (multidrug efflux system)